MTSFSLIGPPPFRFEDVLESHGWRRLPPFHWDDESQTLARIERLPDGELILCRLTAIPGGVSVETDASEASLPLIETRLRWILSLDDDLSGFHCFCAQEPPLTDAAERGAGRMLRCSTLWEEVVKTLFSVNTTWRQTVGMTERLVQRYGEPHARGLIAFPTPKRVATVAETELQQECRVGYRAGPLLRLATSLAEGKLDLEALKDPALTDVEVEAQLRALRGIGPYAAANVMMLLGRHDALPVDSWFRQVVRDAWFPGASPSEKELVATFERFRPYRNLVYRFYDWESARRPDTV